MSESAHAPTRSPDILALGAATTTAIAHLGMRKVGASPIFIIGACLFWIGFVVVKWKRDPTILRVWGFRIDNIKQASKIPALFFAISAFALAMIAVVRGTFSLPSQLPLLLLLYPIWGVIQQFLVLAIVVGNLSYIPALRNRTVWLTVLGAMIFGGIHLPNLILTTGTTLLALLYVPLYLKYRNLWPLGVVHGWIGSLFYLWALGINPWVQTFGR
jgi:uncharacterized protein